MQNSQKRSIGFDYRCLRNFIIYSFIIIFSLSLCLCLSFSLFFLIICVSLNVPKAWVFNPRFGSPIGYFSTRALAGRTISKDRGSSDGRVIKFRIFFKFLRFRSHDLARVAYRLRLVARTGKERDAKEREKKKTGVNVFLRSSCIGKFANRAVSIDYRYVQFGNSHRSKVYATCKVKYTYTYS